MARISISLESEAMQAEFYDALRQACTVSHEMIAVKTTLQHDILVKTITTECAHALRVMHTFCAQRRV